MLGYSAERLGELSFQEITYVDDLELDLDLVRDLLAGRINSYQMEKRYLRRDGETFWARISVSLVRDEEESPSTSSPRWRISTVASVPSWSASASPNGSSWPPTPGRSASGSGTWRATACTGISACSTCTASAAVPGRPRWSSGRRACMPRITTACCASWRRAVSGLQKFDCEFRIVRPNREVRHLRAIATLTRDEDNRPVRMIGINSDITEIRTLAETLHEERNACR